MRSQDDKAGQDTKLEDERGFQERVSGGLFVLREGGVCRVGGTVGVQRFNDAGYGAECCKHAARMNRGVVGDVVQNAGKDEIVC